MGFLESFSVVLQAICRLIEKFSVHLSFYYSERHLVYSSEDYDDGYWLTGCFDIDTVAYLVFISKIGLSKLSILFKFINFNLGFHL